VTKCEDAVSRKAVLDLIYADWKYEGLEKPIENMPSVIPKLTECEDAVSRQDILNYLESNSDDFPDYHEAIEVVLELPSVTVHPQEWSEMLVLCDNCGHAIHVKNEDAKEVRQTGGWIKMPIGFKCSNCNELKDRTTKYCPNCGSYNGGDKNGNE